MNDIQTMQNIADLLYTRPDCKTAAWLIRKEIATEKLRREQEMPRSDQVIASCVLSAVAAMMWVMVS